MNGAPPEPLAPKTKLCGWVCLPSLGEAIELADCRIASVSSLFAVHEEEAELVRKSGTAALVEMFHDRDVPIAIDPKRKNVAV